MSTPTKNQAVERMRKWASEIAADLEKKAAGEGAPDRMSAGDGDGGVDVSKKDRPHDVGEDEVKRDQPSDGKIREAAEVPAGGPDRMNAGDGDGGVDVSKDSRPDDPGEEEVKKDQPKDGETRKAATLTERGARIQNLLSQVNPERFPTKEAATAEEPKAEGKTEDPEKKAWEGKAPTLDLSQEVLAKIASALLSTEEGQQHTFQLLNKQAGEDAARTQIAEAQKAAAFLQEQEQVKQAAFNDLQQRTQAIEAQLAQAGVTDADADTILKQAHLIQENFDKYEHPLCKAAYAQGAEEAALMAAADESEEGAPGMDEAIPGGGESLSEEEILALLQEMLAEGLITEEDLAGLGGGAEAPPAEEAAPVEEPAMV